MGRRQCLPFSFFAAAEISMSSLRARLKHQLRDERRRQYLWEIGAEPKPAVSDAQLSLEREHISWFRWHWGIFLLGSLIIGPLLSFQLGIALTSLFFFWSVFLAEHAFRVSRDIGYSVFLGTGTSGYYDINEHRKFRNNAVLKGYKFSIDSRKNYLTISYLYILVAVILLLGFNNIYPAPLRIPAIWFLMTTLCILLGLMSHYFVTVRFRKDIRKSKLLYEITPSFVEAPRPGTQYILSDDGELVEIKDDGHIARQKRRQGDQ
jgi:hypothetical protein